MSNYIPEIVLPYLEALPLSRSNERVSKTIKKCQETYGNDYVDSLIWTLDEARQALALVGIRSNTALYELYLNFIEMPDSYRTEEIFSLSEIRDDFLSPFWDKKYNNISDKFLLLSSIEGEYSYFYDKNNDSIFGVEWSEMDDLISGSLSPTYATSIDFLEWYFSDQDE